MRRAHSLVGLAAYDASPLGVTGCGEAGAIVLPPALINDLCNALRVTAVPLPATPYTAQKAVQAAR